MKVGEKVLVVDNTHPTHYLVMGSVVEVVGISTDRAYLSVSGLSKKDGKPIGQTLNINDVRPVESRSDAEGVFW